jgi:hypothetical protein
MYPGYHDCLHLNLDVGSPTSIVIKFISTSRENTHAVLIHEPSQTWEELTVRYGCLNRMDITVAGWVLEIYPELSAKIEIIKAKIMMALHKCESRYGNSVHDFEEFGADCVLTIS